MNILLRRKLERARARERDARHLPWHEWLEAIRPEVVGILVGIAHNRRAPLQERRAAERALARCGYPEITPGGTPRE